MPTHLIIHKLAWGNTAEHARIERMLVYRQVLS